MRRTPSPRRASAISSDAYGPIMCTPRMRSVLASASIFTKPVVSPSARARPLATNGNWPARYSTPVGLQLLLGLADPGDLRRRVDHPRHRVEVDVAVLAGDPLGDRDALLLGLVREHRAAHDVADRPDTAADWSGTRRRRSTKPRCVELEADRCRRRGPRCAARGRSRRSAGRTSRLRRARGVGPVDRDARSSPAVTSVIVTPSVDREPLLA